MDKEASVNPTTLLEAVTLFADLEVAHDFAVRMRWPNGVFCPRTGCGSGDVSFIASRKKWRCRDCNRQFSVKVGTIFEDSPIGLDKWLPAMWLLSSAKNGISSCELARALGVTQKTAWFVLHRIRCAMQSGSFDLLVGEVEADETYIGGRKRRPNAGARKLGTGPHPGPRQNKAIVHGIMQRGGKVRAFVVPDDRAATLLPNIYRNVDPEARIYTDAHRSYWDLQFTHHHEFVNHMITYVEGHVHTNRIENFWSVLKRTLRGTYINARPQHLARYVEAQVFRFNEREITDGQRFPKVVRGADGKRLTWKLLTREATGRRN